MATETYTSFLKVALLDRQEKSVLSGNCSANIKSTFYSDEELLSMDLSHRNIAFANTITEVELVVTSTNTKKPDLNIGSVYVLNIFDTKQGVSSTCEIAIFKQERTHKLSVSENLYFYTGARISNKGHDRLRLFGFYTPKLILLKHKKNHKISIYKAATQRQEDELFYESKFADYDFFLLTDFLEDKKVDLNDGGIHELQPR